MVRTIHMPSAETIDANYKAGAARAPAAYKAGVERVPNFKERAIAGQSNYVAQMSNSAVLSRRADKLNAMPDGEWKQAALSKGATRIAGGMAAGAGKRRQNYEPIRTKLEGLTLSEKTPDAMANIDNNVKAVVRAMQEAAGKS